ncbi:hypothetical protein CKN80_07475 [Carnobacterium divergens]|uniref:ABC transporter permease n=1 Tax=Carnobacterium divergens TaxID=2748 RepID=UPI001071DA5C|nr:ABC transporter permease subunit [Carnobacterium divergens]TFJ45490.1 hypothetical protein CKN79_07470 [Carnobacterium divergens]TFJ51947.1 hypothetical protein CKN80_07475 [Carnobacterium divergens]
MINLVVNETRKLIFRKSFYVYLGLIFVLTLAAGSLQVYFSQQSAEYTVEENGKSVTKTLEKDEPLFTFDDEGKPVTNLEDAMLLSRDRYLMASKKEKLDYPEELKSAKNELAYYEKYYESGATPITSNNGGQSAGSFFAGLAGMLSIVNMVVVIVASISVASEFSDGTIKLLLIRPFKRSQILLSKLIVCLLFGAFITLFTMLSAGIVGLILFPIQSFMLPASASLGAVSAIKAAGMLAATNYLLIVFYSAISLMISAVFRSQALAVGIGMLTVFASTIINGMLMIAIPKWPILKWSIFNLLNVNTFSQGGVMPGELSLMQTSIALLGYSVVIYLVTMFIFKKRDIALT